jgi:uncharacterized protein (DUF2141 family)
MKINNIICGILYLTLGCASVRAPEGGPKDDTPPKLLYTIPKANSTSFNGKSIVMVFSEEVEENNPKQQFLSPFTSTTVTATGKKLKIESDSGWVPNTTYSLRMKLKVKDSREGNFHKDSLILFSTGQKLDTIHVKITTLDKSAKPSPQKWMALLQNKAIYVGSSDSLVPIKINGLSQAKYLLEVFSDKNENYKYDEDDGNLYIDSITVVDNQEISVKPLPQKIKRTNAFKLRKGDTCTLETSGFIIPEGIFRDKIIAENDEKTQFWLYPFKQTLIHNFTDSLRNCFQDTIDFRTLDTTRSLNSIPLNRKTEFQKENKNLIVNLKWNWAIYVFPTKITITQDSVWKQVDFNTTKTTISFQAPSLKPGKCKIRFDTIAFYNKTGIVLDSVEIPKAEFDPKGTISGKIQMKPNQKLVVELINSTKESVARTNSLNFNFKVKPGKYTLLVFLDEDGDDYYTGGNKKARRKAEPLYIVPDPIELKPGWDLEEIVVTPDF